MSKNLISTNRLEAFSDGVIAIIITLLVLEIKVPYIEAPITSERVLDSLLYLFPKFVSWIISFIMVLVMWVNHHRIFSELKNVDLKILWLNGLVLLTMSFVPFPTALMGDYYQNPVAVSFFGIWLALVGLSFFLLRGIFIKIPFF